MTFVCLRVCVCVCVCVCFFLCAVFCRVASHFAVLCYMRVLGPVSARVCLCACVVHGPLRTSESARKNGSTLDSACACAYVGVCVCACVSVYFVVGSCGAACLYCVAFVL